MNISLVSVHQNNCTGNHLGAAFLWTKNCMCERNCSCDFSDNRADSAIWPPGHPHTDLMKENSQKAGKYRLVVTGGKWRQAADVDWQDLILKAQSTIFQKCHIVWSHGTSTISYKQGKNAVENQQFMARSLWHQGWCCSKSTYFCRNICVDMCIYLSLQSKYRECSLSISARLLRSVCRRWDVSPWCWLSSCLQFPQQRKIVLAVLTWHFSSMLQYDVLLFSNQWRERERM